MRLQKILWLTQVTIIRELQTKEYKESPLLESYNTHKIIDPVEIVIIHSLNYCKLENSCNRDIYIILCYYYEEEQKGKIILVNLLFPSIKIKKIITGKK